MIKQQYSRPSRRALNMIWNAAGRYDFDPFFLAFYGNGKPDDYFNTIIGLTEKWVGLSEVIGFFSSFAGHRRAEEFDEFLWLGLENYVFEREVPERPALTALRRARGEEFFLMQQTLSEQQMTMQSMPVYRQQQYRWASVTGRSLALFSPGERAMAEALLFPGSLQPAALCGRMRAFLVEFFRYDPVREPHRERKVSAWRSFLRRIHSQEYRQKDMLLVRTGSGLEAPDNAVSISWDLPVAAAGSNRTREEDDGFMTALFGRCLLPPEQLTAAERLLCAGVDAGCRLWYVAGQRHDLTHSEKAGLPNGADHEIQVVSRSPAKAMNRKMLTEITDTRRRMEAQAGRNRQYLDTHSLLIRESIRTLTSELDVFLSSFLKGLPEKSHAGRLLAGDAWRMSLLQDPYVFVREGEEKERHITVDLLLDASQSRMNVQEQIAAECFCLAGSLENNRIPVRVLAFRSLRGYTVLEELKSAGSHDCSGVLRYYAAGWNRDGLALRWLHFLEQKNQAQPDTLRLLLVLTDANPNDAWQSPGIGIGTAPGIGKHYEGPAAVDAAAAAVKELRADGIRTAAIYHGSAAHLDNVYRIYGKDYIRVFRLQQFAGSVIDLLQRMLQETDV